MKFFGIMVSLLLSAAAFAQGPMSQEDEEAQLRKAIETQIETYTDMLNLEYWQVFYVDSIMTHDYTAMTEELKQLSESKTSIRDFYVRVQDKWMEKMYQAFRKVFTDEQWNKYQKSGAEREKKARDKREAKRAQ